LQERNNEADGGCSGAVDVVEFVGIFSRLGGDKGIGSGSTILGFRFKSCGCKGGVDEERMGLDLGYKALVAKLGR